MTELIEPAKEENKTTMDSEKTTALVVANENKPSKKKKGFFARPNGKEKKGKKALYFFEILRIRRRIRTTSRSIRHASRNG